MSIILAFEAEFKAMPLPLISSNSSEYRHISQIVPDKKDDIIEAVSRLQRKMNGSGFIFTSGGIGPTPDDITYDAISEAFDLKLELHKPTVQKMSDHYKERGLELVRASKNVVGFKMPTPSAFAAPPSKSLKRNALWNSFYLFI